MDDIKIILREISVLYADKKLKMSLKNIAEKARLRREREKEVVKMKLAQKKADEIRKKKKLRDDMALLFSNRYFKK